MPMIKEKQMNFENKIVTIKPVDSLSLYGDK